MHPAENKIQQLIDRIDFQSIEISSSQVELIQEISQYGLPALSSLAHILHKRQLELLINPIDGLIYDKLISDPNSDIQELAQTYFSKGIVPLISEKNIDYFELQQLLQRKDFLQANMLTQKKICELANLQNKDREWLYFTDIASLPILDLQTIDKLWRIHSLNRFGFSIQRQIWISVEYDWTSLLNKIQWIIDSNLCRYPNEFTWDLNAPRGHLPLFNQLRGPQALTFLLAHPAWN